MGILMSRWLRKHPEDSAVCTSLEAYCSLVSLQLQGENDTVFDRPSQQGRSRKRLYNWPWVLQLHMSVVQLDLNLTGLVVENPPIERFILTLENFYQEGGRDLYAIGLLILEGLRFLQESGDEKMVESALSHYSSLMGKLSFRGVSTTLLSLLMIVLL